MGAKKKMQINTINCRVYMSTNGGHIVCKQNDFENSHPLN